MVVQSWITLLSYCSRSEIPCPRTANPRSWSVPRIMTRRTMVMYHDRDDNGVLLKRNYVAMHTPIARCE